MVVDFLRLIDRPYAGGTSSNFLLQTAAVRYRLRDRATRQPFTLDLLSTVHLAEPAYYSGLQEACTRYDRVLFEVIADGSLAPRDADSGTRRLLQPLQATPAQRELAARHRLVAQMDALTDCMGGPSWAVADLPRDEVLRLERRLGPGSPRALLEPAQQLLSTLAFGPARRRGRRGRTSWLFRLVLCLLPAPEAALLLDDWIASGGAPLTPVLGALARCLAAFDVRAAQRLSFAQTLATGEATQWGSVAAELVRARNAAAMDEVQLAAADGCESVALLYGALHMRDLQRRIEQGYEIVEVEEVEWRTAWTIPTPLTAAPAPDGDAATAAAAAAPLADRLSLWLDDLAEARLAGRGLPSEGGLATEPSPPPVPPPLAPSSAPLAPPGTATAVVSPPPSPSPDMAPTLDSTLLLAMAGLLAVDGSDWVETVTGTLRGALEGDLLGALVVTFLYLLRHGALYLALARWAFEWERRWFLFGGE